MQRSTARLVQEKSNFDIVEDLADHVGTSSTLLVIDNLEDSACFHQHGSLCSLAQRLGTSKLIVTTCNGKLCNVLPASLCFTLTRAENEDHVMFPLMSKLALGTSKRRGMRAVSPEVQVRPPAPDLAVPPTLKLRSGSLRRQSAHAARLAPDETPRECRHRSIHA